MDTFGKNDAFVGLTTQLTNDEKKMQCTSVRNPDKDERCKWEETFFLLVQVRQG